MNVTLDHVEGRHPAAARAAPSAITDLSLSIQRGEQVAVIGPSGSGKTTLLQLIAAALKPLSGHVMVDGQDPWVLSTSALQSLRGRLFYAPQTPPLPPRQRVVTALTAGRLPGMSLWQSVTQLVYPRHVAPAVEALGAFDLSEKIWDRVDRLSGGERQRVGLARALMSPATLWLVDEPLSALDPKRARQAITTLTQRAQARNITLFPRVIGLRDGRVAFDLPSGQVTQSVLAALYAQHEHELAGVAAPVLDIPAEPAPANIVHCR